MEKIFNLVEMKDYILFHHASATFIEELSINYIEDFFHFLIQMENL